MRAVHLAPLHRVWDAASLAPVQALTNGSGWVSDCAYLECPAYKRLVVAAHDRTVGAGRVQVLCSFEMLKQPAQLCG